MMKTFFTRTIATIATYGVVALIFLLIAREQEKEEEKLINNNGFVVRLPKIFIWVGVICSLVSCFFLVLMIAFPNWTEASWVGIVFVIFILIGMFLIIETLLWRIEVFQEKEYFLYRTVFGRKYEIKYSECECYIIKPKMKVLIIKARNKSFYIDTSVSINVDAFLKELRKHRVKQRN